MKKFPSFIFFIFFISNFLFSQQSVIKGVVTDAETGITLPGVNVIVDKTGGVASDVDGKYSLPISKGAHTIVFKFVGYNDETRTVNIKDGETLIVDVKMKSEVKVLDAVVVSAGKFDQKLSDVTVSMEVIKADFIKNSNVTSLEESLQKIPGLNIMDKQPSIRGGSGYSFGAGSRVLFLVDDIPMITGASGEARWDFAPIENVQQVEVIKGASSALYGSSALNGVINYRTAYPGIMPKTVITTIFGQYSKPERKEIIWWGNNSPIFASTRFFHSRQIGNFDLTFGGFISSNNGYRTNNAEDRYRINGTLRYRDKKIKGLSYELSANYMRRIGDVFLLWTDGDSGVYKCNESFKQEINNSYLNLYPILTWYKNDSTKHSFKGRYFQIHNTNNTGQDNFDDMYYAEYNFYKGFPSKELNWNNGICANYNESVAEIYGDLKHFGSSVGFFSQIDKKFNRLNVSLGGRIEGYRIDDDAMKFKPVLRSGVNYSFTESSFLRASFGMGYRYPTIAERYTATSTGDLKVFPNPDLQPETGYSTEIGFKQGFKLLGWNAYADLAAFYTRYHNMIEFMFNYHNPDSVTLVAYPPTSPNYFLNWVGFKAENVRNAEISGIEFVVAGGGNFIGLPASLLLGYIYNNPIDIDVTADSMKSTGENILKYRFYHNAKADFSIEVKKLTFGFNFEYQSHIINIDKIFEDTVRAPNGITPLFNPATGKYAMILPGLKEYREKHNKGFVVFDMRIGWKVNESVHLNFTAKNIFNKEYMMRPGDVQPPRTFLIQLSVKV